MFQIPQTALLGGTFNPVQTAHLRLADAVVEALHLTHLELIPAFVPPHKAVQGLLPYEIRCRLLECAIKGHSSLMLSRLEQELTPPSYTWNLIQAWSEGHSGERPLFILGVEDFCQLDTWYRGKELTKKTSFLIVPRGSGDEHSFRHMVHHLAPCAQFSLLNEDDGKTATPLLCAELSKDTVCLYLPLPVLDISASLVRNKWMRNESIRFLTPDPVIAFLNAHAKEVRTYWSTLKDS